MKAQEVKFKQALDNLKKTKAEADQFADWIQERYYWADTLTELHRILIQVEADSGEKLHTATGIWIEKFVTTQPSDEAPGGGNPGNMGNNAPPIFDNRRTHRPPGSPPEASPAPGARPAGKSSTNEISVITILFRGVNLANATVPSANTDIAYAVESALQQSPFFDKDETHLAGNIDPGDVTGTFTFGVSVKLKHPIKL
jgi:hypothetical protein